VCVYEWCVCVIE